MRRALLALSIVVLFVVGVAIGLYRSSGPADQATVATFPVQDIAWAADQATGESAMISPPAPPSVPATADRSVESDGSRKARQVVANKQQDQILGQWYEVRRELIRADAAFHEWLDEAKAYEEQARRLPVIIPSPPLHLTLVLDKWKDSMPPMEFDPTQPIEEQRRVTPVLLKHLLAQGEHVMKPVFKEWFKLESEWTPPSELYDYLRDLMKDVAALKAHFEEYTEEMQMIRIAVERYSRQRPREPDQRRRIGRFRW